MNLHRVVRGVINSVNPDQNIIIRRSDGYDKQPGGKQIPKYIEIPETVQIQPVQSEDLEHINGYNSSKTYKSFRITGQLSGVIRTEFKGGDIVLWNGQEWLIDSVPEDWADTAGWTHAIGILQNE